MYDARQVYNAAGTKAYLWRDEKTNDVWWGGKGLQHLGVEAAQMSIKAFNKLISNVNPTTGKSLTPRNVKDRIAGIHLTYSPPKDVTLLEHLSPLGPRIRAAVKESVDYSLRAAVEPMAKVRRRKGKHEDVRTGNLIYGCTYHDYDRPQGGRVMCQSHVHVHIINASFDHGHHTGPKFVALKLRDAWFQHRKIKNVFHKRLREHLEGMGLETYGHGQNWGVVGIDRRTIDAFSIRRDAAIGNVREKNVPRNFAGLVGRADKTPVEDREALKEQWRQLLTPRTAAFLESPLPKKRRRDEVRERMYRERFMNAKARQLDAPRKEEPDRGISIA